MTISFLTFEPPPENLEPGIQPIDFGVLVFPLQASKKTASGIIIADDTKELEELSGTVGVIVAMAERAGEERWGEADRPHVGDTVIFLRHAGQLVQGDDRRKYRLMRDIEILGVKRSAKVELTPEDGLYKSR